MTSLRRRVVAGALLMAVVVLPPLEQPGWQTGFPPLPEPGGGMVTASLRSGVSPSRYAEAIGQAAAIPAAPLTELQAWRQRGPLQVGGRITDLLLHDGVLFVASASGGVWRSDDDGRTLAPAWSDLLPPAVGALGILADGTLLAGTGEANAGGGSTTYGGSGLFRSADGGQTWTPAGLPTSHTVARIIGHPTDPGVAWVAAGGDLFAGGGQRGIYRTDDGARSWTLVLPPDTPTTGGADIALDPSDPDHLLAATWDRLRTPAERRYGGVGSGLHASTDGGRTWERVDGGIPGFTEDAGRIAVALSPADPQVGYAVVTRGDGRADGLYRSDDGGGTWRRVDRAGSYEASQFIFGWWFSKVFPAPEDPERVLVPGLSLLESTDGGETFAVDPFVHPDQHALIWDPADASSAWLGSDGGLYRSADGGRTSSWVLGEHQPFTQVYDAAASPAAPDRVLAGFQDLGCLGTEAEDPWRSLAGCGDGVQVLPHPDRQEESVICGQYGRCWLSRIGGGLRALNIPVDRAAWLAPMTRLRGDPDQLRFGGTRVLASADGGATWQAISGDLTRGSSPDPDYAFGTITEILAVDEEGTDLLVGTDDGLVWRTTDAGHTWVRLLDGDRWVTGLAANADGSVLAVGTSGFFQGEATAQLRRSHDGGQTWQGITAGLPDAPVNDLLVAGTSLVVATDVGVFAATGWQGQHDPVWRRVGQGLPQAPAHSIDHLPAQGLLTVGTFGRGVWQTTFAQAGRVAGPDRYATAAQILLEAGPPALDTIVIASGAATADALAAAALIARQDDWGLLLTAPDSLPAATAAALAAVRPGRVLILGGLAAVSEPAAQAAGEAAGGVPVVRIAGADRYATAASLATTPLGDGVGPVSGGVVLLATAGKPFDALAGAALAGARDAPLLLVDPLGLPEATAGALEELAPSHIIALGGQAAVGEAVLRQARDLSSAQAVIVERIAGTGRVETAAQIAQVLTEAARPDAAAPRVWLASATAVTDALAAGATGSPVLLSSSDALPEATRQALLAMRPGQVLLAGGAAVLSDVLIERLTTGSPLGTTG